MQKLKKLTKRLLAKRSPITYIWVAIFGAIGVYFVFFSTAAEISVPLATVSLSTSSANVIVNTTTSVDVKINANSTLLKTANIRVLYDATKLEYVSVNETSSRFTGGGIPIYTAPGIVEVSRFDINGVTGNGLQFATINFRTKSILGSTAVTVGPSGLYQSYNVNNFDQVNSINTQINIIKPPDVTPPTSTITTIPTGVVDTNAYTLNVNATDNEAVARVAIEIVGGAELVSDNTAPYSLAVNTRALANGNYQLRAVSYDTSGNKTVSSPVILKIRLVDINRSGTVEIGDLTAIIASWNQNNTAIPTIAANDLDDDGRVGIGDLTKLITRWGQAQ